MAGCFVGRAVPYGVWLRGGVFRGGVVPLGVVTGGWSRRQVYP